MADSNQNVPETGEKKRKPLKADGAKAFNPSSGTSAVDFLFNQGFHPGFQTQGSQANQQFPQQYQGNHQGANQVFQPQQPYQGPLPAQQTVQLNTSTIKNVLDNITLGSVNHEQKPTTITSQGPGAQNKGQSQQQGDQGKPQDTTKSDQTDNKVKQDQHEAKKETKKGPEAKQQGESKKETKKGGKVDKKIASDAQGKAKEERKDSGTERSYQKLQNLIAAQKNLKPDKIDIEAALKDTSKYDVTIDESRQPLNIVFIGHVDAGKSTTCGNILLLTGQVSEDDIRRLKKEAKEKNRESWWIAYLMDIGDEEKRKGITVEVGKAKFETQNKRMTILDAPGHKNFVPNMIAGASQADVACLVVSARTGEFESGFQKGGQTTEHALLAKSLGVRDLIVLVNKMDESQIGWSQQRYDYIKGELTPFLRDSCGYDLEKNVYWLPISAQSGDNMMTGIKDPRGSWYTGPTFFQLLDNLPVPQRDPEGPVRIPVLDKFKDGSNLNVFGKVESGTITYGMKLTLIPSGESLTIHAIYNNDDKRLPYAKSGENVKLTIKGIEDDYVSKGDIICSNYSFAHVCTELECEINILDLPEHKATMSIGYNCVMHIHAAVEEVYIKEIKAKFSKAEEKLKTAKYLNSGSVGIVRIALKDNHPICCEKYDVSPHLGRFTLRDEGKTIASGKVLRVKPV